MRTPVLLLATTTLTAMTACGSSGGGPGGSGGNCSVAFSCTTPTGQGHSCQEGPIAVQGVQQTCESGAGNAWSTSACSRAGTIGSCRTGTPPNCFTAVYYADTGPTAAQLTATCSQGGGTWTNP